MSELKNTQQAADHVNLEPKTLENWRCQGRGPAYVKLGSRVFYRTEDLDAYVEQNRRVTDEVKGAA